MSPDEARELRETFQRGLERIHERLDSIDAKLAEIPRLDERTQALRADVDRHESHINLAKQDVADVRERMAWTAKLGIGGIGAGGAGIVAAIIDWITNR